ncbi:anaerobic glycerol-3-phosphate dehydrogenase subunit GlpC [Dysgonomonas sp. 511]|uniref:anaerobic glycerol-3-phosphate dehydrogenase subunit GlpC n=1 Tax=Dysgonomonas sp. 511 TaxID=2302930 RepID=UPI0013D8759D|nr:anaerobic glycerol-3-phosphate dehydrogenase subunit GlpC [Dysgonomonas sp. 511]NDV79292.1 anaerobic glycerol-3-phosphate dehydrogenase subunit C [Dysgonomonas sp. 511]
MDTKSLYTSPNNFEECTKCTICTTACPLLNIVDLFPGPKHAGPDGERLRLMDSELYDEALKYCLNCKRCEVACPSGIQIGDIIQAARIEYGKQSFNLRNFLLANTDLVGSLSTMMAPVVNATIKTKPVRRMMDAALRIDHRRIFPKYASQTFESWYKKQADLQQRYNKQVAFFHGCYVNYNHPQLGKDLVKVFNALGIGVQLLKKEKCCGVALISNGFIDQAKKQAEINVASLHESIIGNNVPVVGTSSTCIMTLRDEYPHLLGIDNSDIRDKTELATRHIYRLLMQGSTNLKLNAKKIKVAYHTACHMEKMGWAYYSIELLKMIPNIEVYELKSQCCGIAGTYGFKRENYDTSQAVGGSLFEQIESLDIDFVVSDCETCKWQIEMSTSRECVHPISVLAQALE